MKKTPKDAANAAAYLETVEGKTFAVYPFLGKKRLAGKQNPEEPIRMAAYNELLSRLSYPADQIQIEYPVQIREDEKPRFADIVVFDDKEHKRPFIVVETKEPKKSVGEIQGQRYATILRGLLILDQRFRAIGDSAGQPIPRGSRPHCGHSGIWWCPETGH